MYLIDGIQNVIKTFSKLGKYDIFLVSVRHFTVIGQKQLRKHARAGDLNYFGCNTCREEPLRKAYNYAINKYCVVSALLYSLTFYKIEKSAQIQYFGPDQDGQV